MKLTMKPITRAYKIKTELGYISFVTKKGDYGIGAAKTWCTLGGAVSACALIVALHGGAVDSDSLTIEAV